MALTADDKDWIRDRLDETERRTARYVDHGDANKPGTGDHHTNIRTDLENIVTTLESISRAILVLGERLPPPPPA